MFEQELFTNYTGADATAEILIMLIGAFALGYALRWFQNRIWGCEHCAETELETELRALNSRSDKMAFERVTSNEVDTETIVVQEVVEVEKKTLPMGVKQDDLKIVEGIGPKFESLLNDAGIETWKDLSQASVDALNALLANNASDAFPMHDPSTWPQQARLAHEGAWEDLAKLQDTLNS